jgi:hypothetical protein
MSVDPMLISTSLLGATASSLPMHDTPWALFMMLCDHAKAHRANAEVILKGVHKRLLVKKPHVKMHCLRLLDTLVKNTGEDVCVCVSE